MVAWVDTVLGAAPPGTRTGDLATKTSATLGNAIVAIAKGCVGAGDGGGGVFYWDASSSSGDDGGTIIVPTGSTTGRWRRIYGEAINVRWFGAQASGGDDQPAIQKAIDAAAGGVVYVPPGLYVIGSSTNANALVIHNHYARFIGAGNSSRLELNNSNNALITVSQDSVANDGTIVGVQIKDLQLTANAFAGFWAVTCAFSSNLLLEGITVTSMSYGFGLEPSLPHQIHNAMIRNCTLNVVTNQGIALFNCVDCFISDTNIFMNGWPSNSVGLLYSSGCDGLFVSNLIVTQSQTPIAIQNGLNAIPPKEAFFSRCSIDGGIGNASTIGAIVIWNGQRIHFEDCWVASSGVSLGGAVDAPGVRILNDGSAHSPPCDISLSNCMVLNCGLDGIHIEGGNVIGVNGGACLGNKRAGVYIASASQVRVTGVRCGPQGTGGADGFYASTYGIFVDTGASNILIDGCDLLGNSSSNINNPHAIALSLGTNLL